MKENAPNAVGKNRGEEDMSYVEMAEGTAKLEQGIQENERESLFSEIRRLENELKFITGPANIAEHEELLAAKRKEWEFGQGAIIEEAHTKNYKPGMSFSPRQTKALTVLSNSHADVAKFLEGRKPGHDNDLGIKALLDDYVAEYRAKRKLALLRSSGYESAIQDLDAAVLQYERAFGIESAPLRDLSIVQFELGKAKKNLESVALQIEKFVSSQPGVEDKVKVHRLGVFQKNSYVDYDDFHNLKALTERLLFAQKELMSLQEEYILLIGK